MKVVWTRGAIADRKAVFDHIAEDDLGAAIDLDNRFARIIGRLSGFPEIGRPGLIAGTRELIPHPSYRVVYQLEADEVVILTLVHTARRWPPA